MPILGRMKPAFVHRAILLPLLVALIGCSAPPALTALPASTRPAPALVPIDTLLAQVAPARATVQVADNLAARAARLRARAALMRGPIIDPATRARLAAAIARGAA